MFRSGEGIRYRCGSSVSCIEETRPYPADDPALAWAAEEFVSTVKAVSGAEIPVVATAGASDDVVRLVGSCRATFDGGHGRIVSEWRYEGEKVKFRFEIPKGTTATLCLPGHTPREVTGVVEE